MELKVKKKPGRPTVPKICGIYLIKGPKGKLYVGSSVHIKERLKVHKRLLQKGRHHSYKLQRAYNKYGVDAFEFLLHEQIFFPEDFSKEYKWQLLDSIETFYINKFNSYKYGYNVSDDASRPGNTNTPESICKGIETRRKNGSYTLSKESLEYRGRCIRESENFKLGRQKAGLTRRKPIYQYDIKGNFIREWSGVVECAKAFGVHETRIGKVIYGENKSYKNYRFSKSKLDRLEPLVRKNPSCRAIIKTDMEGVPVKLYNSYKECAVDMDLYPGTVTKKARTNEPINGFILTYGGRHK